MNAQVFPDRTPLPETSPPEKAIRQKRPLSLADPAVWRTTGRKAVKRIAFFSYTPVSDRIRTFVALLSHAGQPAGIRIPAQRMLCFQTHDPDKASPAFPAGKRVLPFFLFSSGSPIPGCRILKDKKIIVNRPVKQIFHPSRKNPVSIAPKTSAVKFFVSQRLFFSGGLRFPRFFP